MLSFFSTNKVPVSFDLIKVDMHSHLIPGIDDGAKSMDETIEMVRGLNELGYEKLITTPHVMSDMFKNTPEIILKGLDAVRNAIDKEGLSIKIEAAAEYYVDENFEDHLNKDNLLVIKDKFLLFELSYLNKPMNLEYMLSKMNELGLQPAFVVRIRAPIVREEGSGQAVRRHAGREEPDRAFIDR